MRARVIVRGEFPAGHRVDLPTICAGDHGHDWRIEVGAEGDISPRTTTVSNIEALTPALHTICKELRYRNLNEMLPGVVPTAEGLAAYIHERLVMEFPEVTVVTVHMGTLYTATLEWQRR